MIDTKLLEKRCYQPIESFKGQHVDTPDGLYIFIDNGADILAVAHLDTVLQSVFFIEQDGFVTSPVLDDRLGVHILLDVLPALGLKYDVLLTTGEERCASTAYHFESLKKYTWMFEFDRRGTDVVMYHYENGETRDAVMSVGAYVGCGSYTDLVDLDSLGCAGFNWGCAYDLEHTYSCYVDLLACEYMIELFVDFYHKYKDTKFKHEQYTYSTHWANYRNVEENDWTNGQEYWLDQVLEDCEWCGHPNYLQETDVDGMNARLCEDCIEYWEKYKEEEFLWLKTFGDLQKT